MQNSVIMIDINEKLRSSAILEYCYIILFTWIHVQSIALTKENTEMQTV